VRDFVSMAFKAVGVAVEWQGEAESERGVDAASGRELVRINPRFYRPAEVDLLIGDASKAHEKLGWKATTSLEELCRMMVSADLVRNERGVSF
jgi:GDPmannose 4,6-dehydratase